MAPRPSTCTSTARMPLGLRITPPLKWRECKRRSGERYGPPGEPELGWLLATGELGLVTSPILPLK